MKRKDIKLNSFLLGFIKLIIISAPFFFAGKVVDFAFVSIAVFICMIALRIKNKKQFLRRYILKVFGIGLISDIIGWIAFFVSLAVFDAIVVEKIIAFPAFVIAVLFVFAFNYSLAFKNIQNEEQVKEIQTLKKYGDKFQFILALIFALITAPWQIIVSFEDFYMLLL